MFVKICGITSEEDALLALAMGADALGFVFAPSPRKVSVAAVADIVRRLPPAVLTIGVFRDELASRVVEVVGEAGLKGAQLHGQETKEDVAHVARYVPFTIKAFPATSAALDEAGDYGAHAVLVDTPSPGSGRVFDWRLAEGAPRHRRLILAGGLTAENVGEAIRRVHPWGVDVSSGVESAPGRKDAAKVRAFVQAARAAEPGRLAPSGAGPYDWRDDW
ncbi:MAG TPA: phosphoribosylanthranilate isomerase [Acidimicrobiales bacterium]|nr:phosphoribosylanthranilate isomerase [Acidimicrobiales bacterium]